MPTRYTKTCIPQYCRYHTEWPKEAFLPAQFQGVQKGRVDASQDTVGVRHARDVAQDRQYLAGDGRQLADGQPKRFWCCTPTRTLTSRGPTGRCTSTTLRTWSKRRSRRWSSARFSTRRTLGPGVKRLVSLVLVVVLP